MEARVRPAGSILTCEGPRKDAAQVEVRSPFDFAIVPAGDVEAVIEDLRSTRPGTTPLALGAASEAAAILENQKFASLAIAEVLKAADGIDLDGWFSERKAEFVRANALFLESRKRSGLSGFFRSFSRSAREVDCATAANLNGPPRGDWPSDLAPTTSLMGLGLWRPDAEIVVALVPTSDSTAAAAHLTFGSFNACAPPEVHVSLARRWKQSHGATLLVNSGDTLQFRVAKPIVDRSDALRMAEEQFWYCDDIVFQGTKTIEGLAASLVNSTIWFFWWD